MVPILTRLQDAIRVLRWSRREQKTTLLGAACFAAIPLVKQLPLGSDIANVVTWIAIGMGVLLLALTTWRLWRFSVAPPVTTAEPEVMAIKGAGSFTPEDAELFAQLGRMEELKQLRSWVLDTDKVPVVAVVGESGVGKTSLLRAGLTYILGRGEEPIPHVYWEATPQDARESLLRKVEAELGTRDLESLPASVIVVDQLEQLDPERNADLFQMLRDHLESVPPFNVTWVLAFRREWGSTWLDLQLDLPERCRHRPQMLSLRRFSQRQAKEVFATLAEKADLPVREALVEEILEQIAEEGTVSPVDLGITLQVLHRQPDLAEDPAAFRSVGGHAGLLTRYLEMALEDHRPALREEVQRALLGLIDEEEDRRLPDGLPLDELHALASPQSPRHFDFALEALAQPGVRVLEIVEDSPRKYRLIHERFIPALRRLAGELLGAADRASRLLERRFLLWDREDRRGRYLLHGRELREILVQRGTLRWGKAREEKQRYLKVSCHRRRQRWSMAVAAVAVLSVVTSWAIHEQRAHDAQKEMFEWGVPAGTYNALPRVTDLALPQVTNTRWVSRAKNLRSLSLSLARHYTTDRVQEWPPSLEQLTLETGRAGVSSWPELPSYLQQLDLEVCGSGVSSWPELPSSLTQLTLDVSYSAVSSWPELPSSLKQLSLDIGGSGSSSLPELPSALEQLTLDLARSGVSSLPELPSALEQLVLDISMSSIGDLPKLPPSLQKFAVITNVPYCSQLPELTPSLQQLTVDISGSEVSQVPQLPSALQQLTLNLSRSGVLTWPELPLSLRQLHLVISQTRLISWPAFSSSLKLIRLDIIGPEAEVPGLPELPPSLHSLTIYVFISDLPNWPALSPSLQQLTLLLNAPLISDLPELPPFLRQLTLDISYSGVLTLPELPSSLQQLTLNISGLRISSLPELPPSLEQLNLILTNSDVSSLPELPKSLQQLTLDVSGTGVSSWPELPSSLQQLTLDVSGTGVSSWPELPSSLQQLILDVSGTGVSSWPELPSSLQQLTLDLRESEVSSWPTLPRALRCLALEFSQGTSIGLPDLPADMKLFKLGVGKEAGDSGFFCGDNQEASDS